MADKLTKLPSLANVYSPRRFSRFRLFPPARRLFACSLACSCGRSLFIRPFGLGWVGLALLGIGLAYGSCFTNDDAYVVSGSEDGRVHFWSLVEGELLHSLGGQDEDGDTGHLAEAKRMHDADEDEGQKDAEDQTQGGGGGGGGEGGVGAAGAAVRERQRSRVGHSRAVTSLDYHPKDICIVTASHDGTVRCWK